MISKNLKINSQKKKTSRSRIGRKLSLGILIIALTPLLISGYISYTVTHDILVERTLNDLKRDVEIHAHDLEMELNSFRKNVIFLANTPPIQGIVRARNNNGIDSLGSSTYTEWSNRLGDAFKEISKANTTYSQVRYLDENGQELVRIDSDGINISRKTGEELQNKADRYYFIDTMKLKKNELFVSPLDLNREGSPSKIEIPYQPTVRFGTPVFDNRTGIPKGIIIINIKATKLFHSFYTTSSEEKTNFKSVAQEFFIDKDGYYFLNPDKSKEWGGPRDLNTGENIKHDFPKNITSHILSKTSDVLAISENKTILAYHPVFPDNQNKEKFWVIFELIPQNIILEPVLHLRNVLLIIALIFVLLVIIFSFSFSRFISKPIIELTKVTSDIKNGNFLRRSKISRNDELGELSESLNKMADTIIKAKSNIEQQVEKRTKQLENMNKLMIGRELRIIELKKELQTLKKKK